MEKSTKIAVLGAGVEGMETLRYLAAHGFSDVTLFDQNSDIKVELPVGVKTFFGSEAFEHVDCDVVFRSPGVSLKKLSNVRGKITSATKYFFEKCPCPIIGVTGTKGKGTTSTLIYLMLKEAGRDVHLGGNIGESPLKFLDKLTADSLVVLELSSFQLQDLDRSPQIAVVLGVTEDHLDYHGDREEYWQAKEAIVKFQRAEDLVILNHDYASSEYYSKLTPARKIFVSATKGAGDGAHLAGPMIVNCTSAGTCEMILNSSKVALIGKHNLENILPAVAVARELKIAIPQIQKVLMTFKGLPHRLQEVAVVNDVRYFDDSIATIPEPSIAAVQAFTQPVILIAGGSEKGSDYTEWGIALQQAGNLKCVILIGAMAERMSEALKKAPNPKSEFQITKDNDEGRILKGPPSASDGGRALPLEIIRCATFEEAVNRAHEKSVPGDVVVLSPAAASFDMFKNYKERGDKFKELVQKFLKQ